MDYRRYMRLWLRRSWLVALMVLLAGGGAWLVRHGDPKVYEQQSSYLLRPSDRISPEAADNVAGTLSQPDSAIVRTVLGILASHRLRQQYGPTLVNSAHSRTQWTATLRPGSNIVDVQMNGHNPALVSSATKAYSAAAVAAVRRSYRIYQLESLGADGPPVQTGPKVWRTVALAMILAVLLGSCAVAVEGMLRIEPGPLRRQRPTRGAARTASRGKPAKPAAQKPNVREAAGSVTRDGA